MDGGPPPPLAEQPQQPQQPQDNCGDEAGGSGDAERAHSMWRHLPLLVRASSKDSVEYILQALWRTRATGLDSADRAIVRGMLQLQSDAALDPVRPLHPPFSLLLRLPP